MKPMLRAVCLPAFATAPVYTAEPAATASSLQDNAELHSLFDQNQADREINQLDWTAIHFRDGQRRELVGNMLAQGRIRTANDCHAAFVFQHGDDAASYRLTHALATLAMTLDDSKQNRWIVPPLGIGC